MAKLDIGTPPKGRTQRIASATTNAAGNAMERPVPESGTNAIGADMITA